MVLRAQLVQRDAMGTSVASHTSGTFDRYLFCLEVLYSTTCR